MPLSKPWKPLDRATIRQVPERFGIYELATTDGTIIAIDHGVLRDELKTVLAYGDATQVRWQETYSKEEATRLVEEHRDRLER